MPILPFSWFVSCRQCSSEYLPGQGRLGHKAQQDVCRFSEAVIRPPTDLYVLQDHDDREDVEEDKEGEEDPVHEPGRAQIEAGAEQVPGDRDPRNRPGQNPEPERAAS